MTPSPDSPEDQHLVHALDELRKADNTTRVQAIEPIRRFFDFAHLPPMLREVSRPFAEMADRILQIPASAERTVALRKLLESKDAAVRAALPPR